MWDPSFPKAHSTPRENDSIITEVENLVNLDFSLVILKAVILSFSLSESGWVLCAPFTSNLVILPLIYRPAYMNHPTSQHLCQKTLHPPPDLSPSEKLHTLYRSKTSSGFLHKSQNKIVEYGAIKWDFVLKLCSGLTLLFAGWRPQFPHG